MADVKIRPGGNGGGLKKPVSNTKNILHIKPVSNTKNILHIKLPPSKK